MTKELYIDHSRHPENKTMLTLYIEPEDIQYTIDFATKIYNELGVDKIVIHDVSSDSVIGDYLLEKGYPVEFLKATKP